MKPLHIRVLLELLWRKNPISKYVPDKIYLSVRYRFRFGNNIDWKEPKTFNEKIQWLKLYDHNPNYIQLVDKYEAKKIVSKLIGNEYIIPTLGIWDDFDDIDFEKLPNQFVLKCTHDSGSIVIVKDKNKLDKVVTKKKINNALKKDYYIRGREWPYKNVKPRIIAEQYMTDETGTELKDYKVFNFNGEPMFIQVDYGRFTNHKRNLYSTDWKYIEASIKYPTDSTVSITKPEKLDEMLDLARRLSNGIPHVRTDFYIVDGKIYFGEMTFYHGSGFESFKPEEFGQQIGNMLILPNQKI
jgi:hypothetical protein